MASLDIEELLGEIAADAPCGENLEDDFSFIELQEKAKIIPEQQLGDQIQAEQLPNWREVRQDLLKLMKKTRDLRLLLELVRASLNLDGAEGLAESLEVLRRSLETYWDTLHPQLDPEDNNDPTQRVNILKGLCGMGSMLRFVQTTPLVQSRAFGSYSLRDIHIASGKLPTPQDMEVASSATIKAAFAEAAENNSEILRKTHAALQASFDSAEQIEALLTQEIGSRNAPSLQALRDKLQEARYAMEEHMVFDELEIEVGQTESPKPETSLPKTPLQASQAVKESIPLTLGINNRQDVIRALDLICEYYAKHEPSSPVPLLLKRAKRLADKGFMEIIEDLAPDGMSQIQWIKGSSPDGGG